MSTSNFNQVFIQWCIFVKWFDWMIQWAVPGEHNCIEFTHMWATRNLVDTLFHTQPHHFYLNNTWTRFDQASLWGVLAICRFRLAAIGRERQIEQRWWYYIVTSIYCHTPSTANHIMFHNVCWLNYTRNVFPSSISNPQFWFYLNILYALSRLIKEVLNSRHF